MLTNTAITSAAPIAQLFAGRNIHFEPAAGSSLAALARISATALAAAEIEGEGGLTAYSQLLQRTSMQADVDGVNEHDNAMEQMRAAVVGAIRYNLNLAKTVVNPQISKLVDGLDAAYRNVEEASVNRYTIVPSVHTPALETGLFEEVAERFAETRAQRITWDVKIPLPENINRYLQTGNVEYDAALRETVDMLGNDCIVSIWNRLFNSGASTIEELFPINNRRNWGELVLAYVIVKNVQQDMPAGINADLDRVKTFLVELETQIGRMIAIAHRQRQLHDRSGRVILSAPRTQSGEIVVNPDTYNGYIEQGGSPEAVLGAVNSQESLTSSRELLEEKPRLERQWAAATRIRRETSTANRFSTTIDYLRVEISKMIAELPEEIENDKRQALYARLDSALSTLTSSVLEDTWSEVRRVLCWTLYSYCAVETILKGIDREAATSPDTTVESAALLACVDYYVDWICGQIVKVQNP